MSATTGLDTSELAAAIAVARAVQGDVDRRLPEMLEDLSLLVGMESPTFDIAHCDRVATWLRERVTREGVRTELVPGANGLYLHAQIGGSGRARVALLCHHDTVFPLGTTQRWSFLRDGDRVRGPGVCDMKGGIVVAMYSMFALRSHPRVFATLELISAPDEEERDGPPDTLARVKEFDAVLCMECGREDGSIVSERKGGLWTKLTSVGRAAHAGTEPDAGVNAVAALAPEVMRIQALHHARPGMTAQVTRFNGGVGINTVPAQAELVADIRAVSEADLEWASRQLDPRPGEYRIARTDLARTPAMERTPRVRAMASAARRIGSSLGHSFGEASTGGTSDAAWAAALGVPTIDGLGPVGGLDHTPDEYAELATFSPRCAVSAGLVAAINDGLLDARTAC